MNQINFFEEDIQFQLENSEKIVEWLIGTVNHYGFNVEAINYIFCSDDFLLQVNRDALDHDYFTDIITFPLHSAGSKNLLSDLFISVDRVAENAKERSLTFEEELLRVMVHGLLHLCGFDDQDEASAIAMREAEDLALAKIDVPRGTLG